MVGWLVGLLVGWLAQIHISVGACFNSNRYRLLKRTCYSNIARLLKRKSLCFNSTTVWFCLDSYTCWFCGTIHAANCARGFMWIPFDGENLPIWWFLGVGSKNHASGFSGSGTPIVLWVKQCHKPPISKWFIPFIYIYLWCSGEWFVFVLPTWINIRFNATDMLFLNSTCPSIFACWHHSIPFCCTVSNPRTKWVFAA